MSLGLHNGLNNGSSEFTEAAKRFMPYWESVSGELREALYSAWEDARGQQWAHVTKLHLLRALLKDGRVQSHVTLSDRDIGKLTSLITDQLRIIPKVDPTDAQREGTPPGGLQMTWGADLLQVLGDAAVKARYYRHAKIDVWLAFDLLRADKDLDGNFSFAKSGFGNDNDTRIEQIQELFHRGSTETAQLSVQVLKLESENLKLKEELTKTREQLTQVQTEFQRAQANFARLNDLVSRFQMLEQNVNQQAQMVHQINGTLNFALPMVQDVRMALVNAARPQPVYQPMVPQAPMQAAAPPAAAADQKSAGWLNSLFTGRGSSDNGHSQQATSGNASAQTPSAQLGGLGGEAAAIPMPAPAHAAPAAAAQAAAPQPISSLGSLAGAGIPPAVGGQPARPAVTSGSVPSVPSQPASAPSVAQQMAQTNGANGVHPPAQRNGVAAPAPSTSAQPTALPPKGLAVAK
jgi:hypothetical protein